MTKLVAVLIFGLILMADARPKGQRRGKNRMKGFPIGAPPPPVVVDDEPVPPLMILGTTESPLLEGATATPPAGLINTTPQGDYYNEEDDDDYYDYEDEDDESEDEDEYGDEDEEGDDGVYDYGAGDGELELNATLGTAIPATNDTDMSPDALLVRYGSDPAQRGLSSFQPLPLTESDAVTDQWTLDSDACSSPNPTYWRGRRYRLKGDVSLSLIYDYQGALAGVQVAFTPFNPATYPDSLIYRNVFNVEGGLRVGTVYFKPPASICSAVNLTVEAGAQSMGQTLGDQLFIQTGQDPINQYAHIHKSEMELVTKSMWKPGSCLAGLGRHYWFNTTTLTPCPNFVPISLLYNAGMLSGFSWTFRADQGQAAYASPRFEKLTTAMTTTFFENNQPTCLVGVQMATMHFFFQREPWNNIC